MLIETTTIVKIIFSSTIWYQRLQNEVSFVKEKKRLTTPPKNHHFSRGQERVKGVSQNYTCTIYPSTCEKMQVKLATQVFSLSMASGIRFYRRRGVYSLANSEETEEFTLFVNDFFDVMNHCFPDKRIVRNSTDLAILNLGVKWLDKWKKELKTGVIIKDMFLNKEHIRRTLCHLEIYKRTF